MSDIQTRLDQGGITTVAADNSIPLTAAEYGHPALPGRTIVRLVPEPLLPAEDLSLGVIGLRSQGHAPVGQVRRRAIGFPAWPILTDPDNARHALNLVADLERIGRLARSKPGHAKDRVGELVEELDSSAPHFLPTLLEEAGRFFLESGNATHAAQMFGKARDAERRHSLQIDEQRHAEVLLEFAYAGAISGKELTAEARSLADRLPAAEAYQIFRTLCVERVRGGLQPYAGMQKDLTTLAKAAGLNPHSEDAGVATELLLAPSIDRAPEHFWKAYAKAIRQAAADSTEVPDRLAALTPPDACRLDDWLAVLEQTGALERVRGGAHPDFAQRMIDAEQRSAFGYFADPARADEERSKRLHDVLADLLPVAGAAGFAVTDDGLSNVPVELLELLVAEGIEISVLPSRWRSRNPELDLGPWIRRQDRPDLVHLGALGDEHPLTVALRLGAVKARSIPGGPAAMAACTATRQIWLDILEMVDDALTGHPNGTQRLLAAENLAAPFAEFTDDPEISAAVERIAHHFADPDQILVDVLRIGFPEELGWAAYEEASRELAGPDGVRTVQSRTCWPDSILWSSNQLAVVRQDSIERPTNHTGQRVDEAQLADGQVGVTNDDNFSRMLKWSGDPDTALKAHTTYEDESWLAASLQTDSGRVCGPGSVLRAGEPTWPYRDAHLFADGDRIWAVTDDEVVELEPGTARPGRASLPDWLARHQAGHPELTLQPDSCQHLPVTDQTTGSLLSTADGFHRCAVFTRDDDENFHLVVDADGTEYRHQSIDLDGQRRFCGVLQRPGGGHWLVTDEGILDLASGQPVGWSADALEDLVVWHHFRPRDAEASRRFRTITTEPITGLVQQARELSDTEDGLAALVKLVGEHLQISDPILAEAIALHLHAIARLWRPAAAESPTAVRPETPHLDQHQLLLQSALSAYWHRFTTIEVWNVAARLGLTDPGHRRTYRESGGWELLLGREQVLLALAALPGRTADEARALQEFWRAFRDAGWLSSEGVLVQEVSVPDSVAHQRYDLPEGICLSGETQRNYHEDTHAIVVRTDDGEDFKLHGQPVTVRASRGPFGVRPDLDQAFEALIARLEADGPSWSKPMVEEFAAQAGLSHAEAALLLAGCHSFADYNQNFLPKELRTAMGLKVAEADKARDLLKRHWNHFIELWAAAVPEDDPARVVAEGIDLTAMAEHWKRATGSGDLELPQELLGNLPSFLDRAKVARLFADDRAAEAWADEVATLLWLTEHLVWDSPLRGRLVETAAQLAHGPTGLEAVSLGTDYAYDGPSKSRRGLLGLPPRTDTPLMPEETIRRGRYTIIQDPFCDEVRVDLSGITDIADPDLELADQLSILANGHGGQELSALRIHLDGSLALFTESLSTQQSGDRHDPQVADPGLVQQVAAALSVSEDAARYHLQLLALGNPTDTNVRTWNGWKTRDIAAAGGELIGIGVAVEAKRPRSGRSFFLPGGWAEAEPPHLPIESWKVREHRFAQLSGRSRFSPLWPIALLPQPLEHWFRHCWQRSRGDVPGFDELTTSRSRR